MGRKKKDGFTLIELIVVLVIMAILAAAAIPTMMGYVEKARGAQHLAEARAVYVAATAAATEAYGTFGALAEPGETMTVPVIFVEEGHSTSTTALKFIEKRVWEMCHNGLPTSNGADGKHATAIIIITPEGRVNEVIYSTPYAAQPQWVVNITITGNGDVATYEKVPIKDTEKT